MSNDAITWALQGEIIKINGGKMSKRVQVGQVWEHIYDGRKLEVVEVSKGRVEWRNMETGRRTSTRIDVVFGTCGYRKVSNAGTLPLEPQPPVTTTEGKPTRSEPWRNYIPNVGDTFIRKTNGKVVKLLEIDATHAILGLGNGEEKIMSRDSLRRHFVPANSPTDVVGITTVAKRRCNKDQAAKYLGVSTRTLERYLADEKLPSLLVHGKTGKVVMIPFAELHKFREELYREAYRNQANATEKKTELKVVPQPVFIPDVVLPAKEQPRGLCAFLRRLFKGGTP